MVAHKIDVGIEQRAEVAYMMYMDIRRLLSGVNREITETGCQRVSQSE